jgi:signal transduction histidine kinase
VIGPRRFAPTAFIAFSVALVAAASAAALLVVYSTGERIIVEREQDEARAELALLEEVAEEQGLPTLINQVERRTRFAASGERYGVFDRSGKPLAGDIDPQTDVLSGEADWREVALTGANPEVIHEASVALPGGVKLVVGRDQSSLQQFARSVFYGFLAALGIVAAAGLAAGLILNAQILRRVEAIAATAERIASGDLSARTPLSDRRDPFGRIGASLNAMLERIEELMTGMRTVADSLAHDLRSPLMRMKGALSRAQDAGEDEAARSVAISEAQREAERTLSTLTALLDIARAETGLSREMMRPVDLGALAEDVADFFAPALEDAGQTLTVAAPPGGLMAQAHEPLLRQAIGNLLHNASQYAGEGAEVRLAVEAGEGGTVRVVVADTGHGVPEEHRGRVQERFVRLDPARAVGGSGLGLAIVAACAKLHGGALRLEDNAPGLRAVMEFKRA